MGVARVRGLLAVAVTSAAAVVPVLLAPSVAGAATSCAPVQVLGFRGSGEGLGTDGAGGSLDNVITAAQTVDYSDGFHASSAQIVGVPYEAVAPDAILDDPASLTASVQDGVNRGLAIIRACQGKSAFVLAGYSQGMMVVHQLALAAPAGTVAGTFGYGDPYQEPNGAGVHGTGSGASGTGIEREPLLATPNANGTYASDAFYALPIDNWTYCHDGDAICEFTTVSQATSAAASTAHGSYGAGAERTLLGNALADVLHAAAVRGPAGGSAASGAGATSPASSPVARAATTLHVTRLAKGAVTGTAVEPKAKVPDGAVVTIQGRANSRAAWKTVATTKVRKGAFTSRWPSGRTPSQLRAVLSAGSSWKTATATIGAVPKKR